MMNVDQRISNWEGNAFLLFLSAFGIPRITSLRLAYQPDEFGI
jgi:hypothetical protein